MDPDAGEGDAVAAAGDTSRMRQVFIQMKKLGELRLSRKTCRYGTTFGDGVRFYAHRAFGRLPTETLKSLGPVAGLVQLALRRDARRDARAAGTGTSRRARLRGTGKGRRPLVGRTWELGRHLQLYQQTGAGSDLTTSLASVPERAHASA